MVLKLQQMEKYLITDYHFISILVLYCPQVTPTPELGQNSPGRGEEDGYSIPRYWKVMTAPSSYLIISQRQVCNDINLQSMLSFENQYYLHKILKSNTKQTKPRYVSIGSFLVASIIIHYVRQLYTDSHRQSKSIMIKTELVSPLAMLSFKNQDDLHTIFL